MTDDGRTSLIDALKRRAPPTDVIDPPRLAQGGSPEIRAVESATPADVADCVVLLRPLSLEERLGSPVVVLLAKIRPNGGAPMVPDHRGRAEPEPMTQCGQTPADV